VIGNQQYWTLLWKQFPPLYLNRPIVDTKGDSGEPLDDQTDPVRELGHVRVRILVQIGRAEKFRATRPRSAWGMWSLSDPLPDSHGSVIRRRLLRFLVFEVSA